MSISFATTIRQLIVVAAVFASGLSAASASASGPVTIDDGHVDYAARLVNGQLESMVKDGTGNVPVWREPRDVRFLLRKEARRQIPAKPAFSFLGSPGDHSWLIPEVNQPGLVWLGWNTEAIPSGAVEGDVRWTLESVEGPGQVAVYQSTETGPEIFMNSGDGLPDSFMVRTGVHAHANWAFSAAGEYRLTFTHSASIGGQTQSDTETVLIDVEGVNGGDPPVDPPPDPEVNSRLVADASRSRVKNGRLHLRTRCVGQTKSCRATVRTELRFKSKRGRPESRIPLGKKSLKLPVGSSRVLRFTVPPRKMRALRASGSKKVRVVASFAQLDSGERSRRHFQVRVIGGPMRR